MKDFSGVVPASLRLAPKTNKAPWDNVDLNGQDWLFHPPLQRPTTSLGNRVWHDQDGDGKQDADEVGMAGVVVKLLNQKGMVVAQTTSDVNGSYLFNKLAAGSYKVQFEAPAGYEFTKQNAAKDGRDSDVDETGLTSSYYLHHGQRNNSVDAGLVKQTSTSSTSIGDKVWLDNNANGLQDQNEKGLAGVKVELRAYKQVFYSQIALDGVMPPREDLSYTNKVIATAITDKDGNYRFDHVEPTLIERPDGSSMLDGQYYLQFTRPDGYSFTRSGAGNDRALDSDVSSLGRTRPFSLKAGDQISNLDAGLIKNSPVKTGSIGDRVWLDDNANGIQDAGEKGVAGVEVWLEANRPMFLMGEKGDNNYVDFAPKSVKTDANGFYKFDNLPAGDYFARFIKPLGYEFSPRDVGANDGQDSDASALMGITRNIAVQSGQHIKHVDAGLVKAPTEPSASIGDRVWLDNNANGIQDAGERGVAGVKVVLSKAPPAPQPDQIVLNPDGTTTVIPGPKYVPPQPIETVTDANGFYKFDHLGDGEFNLHFMAPDGYMFTKPNVANGLSDSNADAYGRVTNIDLAKNQVLNHIDAGLVPLEKVIINSPPERPAAGLPKASELLSDDRSLDLYFGEVSAITSIQSGAESAATNSDALRQMTRLYDELI